MLINSLRDHRGSWARAGCLPAPVARAARAKATHNWRPRIPFPDGDRPVRELQALVRERVELYVGQRQAVSIAQAQGCPVTLRFDGERPERIGHFALLHAAPKT